MGVTENGKRKGREKVAEKEGFEPSVGAYDPTTV
jgi:hypothetical protein